MGMAFSLSALFSSQALADDTVGEMAQAQAAIATAKQNALELARATAQSENRQPTLTDYYQSAMTMPELGQNGRIIADLSGQKLDGFLIRKDDIHPEPEQGIRNMRNFINADGNDSVEVEAIGKFYSDVQNYMKFDGAQFHNVTFQPATTLEIVCSAKGATYANITLDGLDKGEVLTIGTMETGSGRAREVFSNVHLINDKGGTIRVAANATLNGLSAKQGHTVLEIAGEGQVNQLDMKNETVSLKAHSNSRMFMPRFDNVNFTEDSGMSGAILQGDSSDRYGFIGGNMRGMKFDGADISGIIFDKVDMQNASFRDAQRLSNCVFKDIDITKIDFSGADIHNLTVIKDGQTHVLPDLKAVQQFQLAQPAINAALEIGRGLGASIASLSKSSVELSQTPIADLQRGPVLVRPDSPGELTATPTGGDSVRTLIVGGEHLASISDVQSDRQGANENALTLNTPEAREARYAIAAAQMEKLGLA